MQMDITCPQCQKLLVTISKDKITQDDIDLYRSMVQCADHPTEQINTEVIGDE